VQMIAILKAYAYLQGETEVNEDIFEILNHVIWNHPRERVTIGKIIAKIGNPINVFAQEILTTITDKLTDLGACPEFGTRTDKEEWATIGTGILSDIRNMVDSLQTQIAQYPHKAKKAENIILEIETRKKSLLAKVSEILYGA